MNKIKKKGAESIVIGCTELPLIVNKKDSPIRIFDTLQILAESAVKESRKGLTKQVLIEKTL